MKGKISGKTKVTIVMLCISLPVIIVAGIKLGNRYYYLISAVVLVLAIIPFFVGFEDKKPQPKELVILAVMSAIAVASRTVFAAIPAFKPMTGIIMITGFAFGPQAGFLTGGISAFVSDFIFGQGPWTPWQIFAFGLAGFLAGLLMETGFLKKEKKWQIVVFGGVTVQAIIGPFLDVCTIFLTLSLPTNTTAAMIFASGVPYNAVHAAATMLTLFFLFRPMMNKLERIKEKYGMMTPQLQLPEEANTEQNGKETL